MEDAKTMILFVKKSINSSIYFGYIMIYFIYLFCQITTFKGKTKSMFGSYGINRVNKK